MKREVSIIHNEDLIERKKQLGLPDSFINELDPHGVNYVHFVVLEEEWSKVLGLFKFRNTDIPVEVHLVIPSDVVYDIVKEVEIEMEDYDRKVH